MASGQPVIEITEVMPPAANSAVITARTGGSTPAEIVPVYQFDASTIQYMDFRCRLFNYAGGGLTFLLPWSAATATTGATRWEIAIRRFQDDAEDLDASHTYDFNAVDDTAASASGELSYPTITFTDGSDMDNWSVGEMAIIRVRRNASHANDNMAGFAELWDLFGRET